MVPSQKSTCYRSGSARFLRRLLRWGCIEVRSRDTTLETQAGVELVLHVNWTHLSTPNGIRTRATTLKGWRPRPLDDGGKGRWMAVATSD